MCHAGVPVAVRWTARPRFPRSRARRFAPSLARLDELTLARIEQERKGRQALAAALFTKLEMEGYQGMRYELTPNAVDPGLGAALPAQLETVGHTGGFGQDERSRAHTFQISVTVLDGDGARIVSRSSEVA